MNRRYIIYFMGMDGSGKSTLSTYLLEELTKRNYRVAYRWWLNPDKTLIGRLLGMVGRHKNAQIRQKVQSVQAQERSIFRTLFSALYPRLILLDNLLYGIRLFYFSHGSESRVYIMDRYVYDIVFALVKEFKYPERDTQKILKFYNRILPPPDLVYFIRVAPETAYQRKKDELLSLDIAQRKAEEYGRYYTFLEAVSGSGTKMQVFDNAADIDISKAALLADVLSRLDVEK